MSKEIEIRQHNALTNARYEYTELQLDLLFFLLSKLRKDKQDSIYELNIKDLSLLTGKKYNAAYLHKATSDMGSRVFEVQTETRYRQLWMFQRVDYLLGQGIIEIKLTEDITPYLFDLKENFTSYELASALRLTSKYAKRIYQYCSQWKDQGETKKYDIQDFKHMLGLLDDKGKDKAVRMSDFRESVLDVAVKQINEKTDLLIGYKLEKVGRGFKNIVFTVKPQVVARPLSFGVLSDEAHDLASHQVDNVRRLLSQLSIVTPELVDQILASPAHVAACNKFAHELKTGKHDKAHSLSGLLLTILGLKKGSSGPLFDKPAKAR